MNKIQNIFVCALMFPAVCLAGELEKISDVTLVDGCWSAGCEDPWSYDRGYGAYGW